MDRMVPSLPPRTGAGGVDEREDHSALVPVDVVRDDAGQHTAAFEQNARAVKKKHTKNHNEDCY